MFLKVVSYASWLLRYMADSIENQVDESQDYQDYYDYPVGQYYGNEL